jgi:Uncharacterized anaerobic dehydrogenase
MSCPQCFTGSVHEGAPKGKIVKLHGLDAYVSEPEEGKPVKGIIIIIPDAFGWEFVNNRILADHYAEKGSYKVYLPEFMNGKLHYQFKRSNEDAYCAYMDTHWMLLIAGY